MIPWKSLLDIWVREKGRKKIEKEKTFTLRWNFEYMLGTIRGVLTLRVLFQLSGPWVQRGRINLR